MSEQEWEDKLAEVQKHSEHWYNKYKELENKIADIKANCDHAIEGRDVKIMELEADNDARKFAMAMSEKVEKQLREQLTKAKEIIQNIIRVTWGEGWNYSLNWKVKAEQFIKEIE